MVEESLHEHEPACLLLAAHRLPPVVQHLDDGVEVGQADPGGVGSYHRALDRVREGGRWPGGLRRGLAEDLMREWPIQSHIKGSDTSRG